MSTAERIRENRLRAMAQRQGVAITKSRRRNRRAYDYQGWMIVDPSTNDVLAGANPVAYSLSIDQVEEWLTSDPEKR
jgi:hypothetical protein